LTRHHILVGTAADGGEVKVTPYHTDLLLAGTSGSGKSTLATGLMERFAEHKYQFCVIDPEGDYETFEIATAVGSPQRAPTVDEVLQLLKKPQVNAVVNLVGLPIVDRPSFFLTLLPRLQEMRARTGRPHWLVLDEAHHLLPSSWEPGALALPPALQGVVMITVHPGMIARPALSSVNTLAVIGSAPSAMFDDFSHAVGGRAPAVQTSPLEPGQALLWRRGSGEAPVRMRAAACKAERRRHTRKYAEGELPPER